MNTGGRVQSVPFELLREAWNEYVFSDQVLVRARLILTSVFQEFEFGPLYFQLDKVTTVSAPEELKGSPGVFEQGSVCNGPRWECQILLRDERWNEYSLADGTYFAKMIFVANKVFRRASAYDRLDSLFIWLRESP